MSSPDKHFSQIKRAFLGSRIFEGEKRALFKREILETSRRRSHVTLYLILGIQLVNIHFNLNTVQHETHLDMIRLGTIIISCICLIYSALFIYSKYRKRKSYMYDAVVVKSFWALMLISSFWFSITNFAEGQAAAYNITLFIFGLGIIPILSLTEIVIYLGLYMLVNCIIALFYNAPAYLLQQIAILNVISVYASQTQYLSSVRFFIEREHLNDQNEQLEKLSETDPLTGLLNRRGLESHIEGFDSYYTYSRKFVCVLMVSLDQHIDSTLHRSGDECITKVADCLRSFFTQKTDAIAYFENGEFLVIADTKNDGAISLALNVKRAVEALDLHTEVGSDRITVSIGIASPGAGKLSEGETNPLTELMSDADSQLLNAKSCGRNCVSSGDIIFR